MTKKALITGITGQDGSYLAEFLLAKGYEVHGLKRRSASFNEERISHIKNDKFFLHHADLTDEGNLLRIIKEVEPDEIYNLAAQSHVAISWDIPEYTINTDGLGVVRILEIIRALGLAEKTKFYQASTSELFSGKLGEAPQNEETTLQPQTPYALGKLLGFWAVRVYRKGFGIFACNGILFNHESPRRGENFVTRKIAKAAAKISLGLQDTVYLGNLNAKRDWGHAKDYVEMMWLMLQQETPEDFIISSGHSRSVREFCEIAFRKVGISLTWQGEGVNEKGIDKKTNKVVVAVDPQFFRPADVEALEGDPKKAKEKLGWSPKITFEQLVEEMVNAELDKAKKEL
ncbi:MAG: GDP-mannose 4,6-dehydratase [Candidatus Pacebacteria bacterium]|nr:GDP-mannose 4,6-dehydratase [Candidatus Paceibacterota bacterium]